MSPLILFVDGFPTSFSLRQEEDKYILTPFENPYDRQVPSKLEVTRCGSQWLIQGTEDVDLIEQLKEDLSLTAVVH
ncbi:MAG: hypothetical protein ACM3VS_16755 [Candidatus Dadabacteria bacterium]